MELDRYIALLAALNSEFPTASSGELSPAAGRVAIAALDHLSQEIRARLETLAEDEAADLSNDLGFIEAVRSDLRRSFEQPETSPRPPPPPWHRSRHRQ